MSSWDMGHIYGGVGYKSDISSNSSSVGPPDTHQHHINITGNSQQPPPTPYGTMPMSMLSHHVPMHHHHLDPYQHHLQQHATLPPPLGPSNHIHPGGPILHQPTASYVHEFHHATQHHRLGVPPSAPPIYPQQQHIYQTAPHPQISPTVPIPIDHGIHSQHIQPPMSIHPGGSHFHSNPPTVDPYHGGHALKLPTVQTPPLPVQGNISAPVPVPHTPQGAPMVHPFGHLTPGTIADKGPELPAHLTEQGWSKCWSKREGRYYFFNCNTNESLWELPVPGKPQHHGHHYNPMTDPLGIQQADAHAGMKRRASSGEHIGSPPVKRIILSGPWDLEIPSNVYINEPQLPRHQLLPPHPQVEQIRYQLLAKLRQCYQQACQSREQIDAPRESLNRWLMEQKISDLKIDPLFPCCESNDGVVSLSLFKEIMNDVPMRLMKPRFTGDARKQLAKFAEACKKTIETRNSSSEHRKLVKWKVEETFTWLKGTVGAPYDALQERLAHLKETIQPVVHEAAKSSVEGICKKISVLSRQYAHQVRETHLNLFVDPRTVQREYDTEAGRYRSHAVLCGEYQFKPDVSGKPLVDYMIEKDCHLIKHKSEMVRLSSLSVQKLDALYKYHVLDDKTRELMLTRVYCLLKRYNAFCNEFNACQTTQGSIPTPVFESIQRNFGVTFECFSSPFNCYFRNYCSAFPDTDGYFGSSGNFLDFHPITGSFQMYPPLCDDLIEAALTHVETLLGATQEAMSFIIFVPEFETKDGICFHDSSWIRRLQNSAWKRKQVTIPAFEHEYRSAAQHIVPKNDVAVRSQHATVVFWLQNDSGFEEWKPTEEKIDAFIDSYRPGRERERDRQELLAPERQNPHQADKAVAAAKAVANNNDGSTTTGLQTSMPANA